MVQMVAHPDLLSINGKCQMATVLAHKAVKMVVRRQACQVLDYHLTLITPNLRCLPPPPPQMQPMRYYVSRSLFFLLSPYLMFLFSNKQYPPAEQSPHIINNSVTRCKYHLNTSRHHTNLIPAHKCLIQHCPCLLEIHLPLPTLSHTIASPVHLSPHPSALSHSSNSLGLTSLPPTLLTPSISSANRLDIGSCAFVPRST